MDQIDVSDILESCKKKISKIKKSWTPNELKVVWITYVSGDYSKDRVRKMLKCGRSALESVFEKMKEYKECKQKEYEQKEDLNDDDFFIISNMIDGGEL